MSSSALPLYNMDKLIYKSGFFNKFKKTLPIVSWFLRKGEKGDGCLPGSGELKTHRRVLPRAGYSGIAGSEEVDKIQLVPVWLATSPSQPKAYIWVIKDVIDPIPGVRD